MEIEKHKLEREGEKRTERGRERGGKGEWKGERKGERGRETEPDVFVKGVIKLQKGNSLATGSLNQKSNLK